jgi:hypothetical protein
LVNAFSGYALHRHAGGAMLIHATGAGHNPADRDAVFAAAFHTPALNDKGAAHVLEHCVLEGSRRYPASPFEQLRANVIWSYLNAMTCEDRTVYTFATPDRPSFDVMYDVYCDALFDPLLCEQTFTREREIVCNEMRGGQYDRFGDARLKAYRQMLVGTSCEFCNMGRADCVNTLTREECIRYYEEYYNPANAVYYFYTPAGWDADEWINILDARLSLASGGKTANSKEMKSRTPESRPPTVCHIDGATFVMLGKKNSPGDVFVCRALFEALSQRLGSRSAYFDDTTPYLVMGFGADVRSVAGALSLITHSDVLRAIGRLNLLRANNYSRYKPPGLMLFLELLPWRLYDGSDAAPTPFETDYDPLTPWWDAEADILSGLSVMKYDIEHNGLTFIAFVIDLPEADRAICHAELLGRMLTERFAEYSHICEVTFHTLCDDYRRAGAVVLACTPDVEETMRVVRDVFARPEFISAGFVRNRDALLDSLAEDISSDSMEWAERFARNDRGWQWIATDAGSCDMAIVFEADGIKNRYVTAAAFDRAILYRLVRTELKAYDVSCSIDEFGGVIRVKSIAASKVGECLRRLINHKKIDASIPEIDISCGLAGYKTAAYNNARPPMHPQDKFLLSVRRAFGNVGREQIEKQMEAIGNCSVADMQKDLANLSIALKSANVCIIGRLASGELANGELANGEFADGELADGKFTGVRFI